MRMWLIGIRKARGMNQKEVADAVGIRQPSYWKYEAGTATPRPAIAKKIAKLLGFDWTLFYEEKAG